MHLLFCFPVSLFAQKDTSRNFKILPLPLFWYTPETKFGGGIAALGSFRFNKTDTAYRVSTVQIGEAYTQEKQWINFSSFQLFPAREKFYIYGEAGYYKYRYYFYDIGNENTDGNKEKYDINFTRIRTNFLFRALSHFYTGLRYWFEKHEVLNLDTNGVLQNGNYLGIPKALTSSPGLVLLYDSRNNLFFPSNGWFAEFTFQMDGKATGSDFDFSRISMDIARYFPIHKNHVLALNLVSSSVTGDAPFSQLSMFGGNKKMRGFYEGRFRDKKMLVFQTEFRFRIFPRWHLNIFSGIGWVADEFSHLQLKFGRFAGGGGLRFMIDKKQKINLRLDGARSIDGNKYYFTFNEAF